MKLKRIIENLERKPKVIISASAIAIYGTSEEGVYDESSPSLAEDFLSSVVDSWEKAIDQIKDIRIVKVRLGIVLGKDGGALKQMMLPYKLGAGGTIGSGKQWLSWIHMDDLTAMIDFSIKNSEISGPVNATAPNPEMNRDFGRLLAKVLRRPNLFPIPAFVMKLIFGELSILLLEGQKVTPQVLLHHGFIFSYPNLEPALLQLSGKG